MKYNTRIAPSPTGFMHIGTARTAYFNWLAARASGGRFILRIDDTDQNRNNKEAIQVIYDSMAWLGLNFDETFAQSETHEFGYYKVCANSLVEAGLAFKHNDAILMRLPDNMPSSWKDEVAGNVAITEHDKKVIENMVLLKSDGWPTYHFSTVIDDYQRNINYIIRGNDHTSNTAKHIAIYLQMQQICPGRYEIPKFAHVGLIHKNKKKMTKRDKDVDPTILLSYYQENGYEPAAVLNFLARMGWGPSVDDKSTTMLPVERMLELFLTGGNMRSAPSGFDMAKLDSFNKKYKHINHI